METLYAFVHPVSGVKVMRVCDDYEAAPIETGTSVGNWLERKEPDTEWWVTKQMGSIQWRASKGRSGPNRLLNTTQVCKLFGRWLITAEWRAKKLGKLVSQLLLSTGFSKAGSWKGNMRNITLIRKYISVYRIFPNERPCITTGCHSNKILMNWNALIDLVMLWALQNLDLMRFLYITPRRSSFSCRHSFCSLNHLLLS